MKKLSKRILASLLAALLIITSVPFTSSITAIAATDEDLASLKSAISEYETKMDGSVYTNMKNAYAKYVTAKELEYAYEYGHDNTADLMSAANDLAAATSAMEEWNGLEVTSPTFTYGTAVPSDYVKGVVYASTPQVFCGTEIQGFKFFALMPKNAVLLYDGSELKIPAMLTAINIKGLGGNDRAALGFMLATASTEKIDGSDVYKDNAYFRFSGAWNGYSKPNKGEGGPSASQFDWSRAFEHEASNSSIPGFDGASVANANENEGNRGEKITSTDKEWYQYTNVIRYVGQNEAFVKGLQTAEYGFVGRSMRWTSVFGTVSTNDYHTYNGQGTFYVIDYRNVAETIKAVGSSYLNIGGNTQYVKNELSDIIDAITYLQEEPTSGFSDSNYLSRATTVAENIQTKKDYLSGVTASATDLSSYDALASAISTAKATYDGNNADGVYTADSFAAFKAAYEASEAEAAKVKTDGFTTATTASALVTAYKNLNTITPADGTSGDTSFTFDEETGKVTVDGEGAMADYENGADSPFGNNDKVKDVTIGDGVDYVGAHAFDGASGLETITVPASATYGEGAFDNCPNLKTVIITGGAVENKSADNAPWKAPKVRTVKLGENEGDLSIISIGDDLFEDNKNTVYYFYNKDTVIPSESGAILGTNPTIHGYIPSTAYNYAKKFNLTFVEISHEHVWDSGTVTAPTCTKGGYTTYKCQFCDETKIGNNTNPLGHDWDGGEIIPPTCTERGYTLYTCQREGCGETKTGSYTKAAGHKYDGEVTAEYATGEFKADIPYKHSIECSVCHEATKSAYCSFVVKGYTEKLGESCIEFECSVCHGTYLYKSDSAAGEHMVFFFGADNSLLSTQRVADGEKATNVPALPDEKAGHIYFWTLNDTEIENPADETIYSDTIFKIKDTFVQYDVSYIDANGAPISSEKVNHGESPADIPALPEGAINRDDDGHDVYAWDKDPNGAVITEDTTFTQVLTLTAHDFIDDIHKEATCVEDGSMSRYCETCGYTVTNEIIPATGNHSYELTTSKDATCTTAGEKKYVCSVCEDTYTETIPAIGHKWDSGTVTKQPTVTSTGVKTYTCSVCKKTKTEVIPKATIADVTPTDSVADKAPVNNKIQKPAGISTVSNQKKKQLIISFNPVAGAQNYRVMYRAQGAAKWNYAWTNGITSYTLKNLKKKGLYEFMFAAYSKNSKGQWERGQYSVTSYRYYYKAKLKKVKASKGKIKVTWARDKNATSYQLYYAKKKNMKGAKKIEIKSNKKTSYTIKGLKKGKYYVRVRAIKKKGKNYIGEYSKRKGVKVK